MTAIRRTTIIEGSEVVTLGETCHARHDIVEIEPVRREGEAFSPIFDATARSAQNVLVETGDLDLVDNPDHVPGAYVNLRHHQARSELQSLGLDLAPGLTHHVPLSLVGELPFLVDLEADGYGTLQSGRLATEIGKAGEAGLRRGATHVAIRIR